MSEARFLQSYVVPVCTFKEIEGEGHTRSIHGTAFLINDCGVFLTAAHVLKDAFRNAREQGREVGLCGKADGGSGDGSVLVRILQYEYAPNPFDIAIGATQYCRAGPLKLAQRAVAPWQDVATLGYPLSSSVRDEDDAFWMNMKVHRGYVVRTTAPRDMTIGTHPDGIELSFLLSPGMSGSPIFTIPDEVVVGVGVGSFRSEEVDDSVIEVQEDGKEFRETRLRVEQFGFAHDVRGLLDWKPNLLAGATLLKASQTTYAELRELSGQVRPPDARRAHE